MEQNQEQMALSLFHSLDMAAQETTIALAHANIRHGFIGGYATSLVGGMRMTSDVDVIVDADPNDARNLLLQAHSGFRLSHSNKLVFLAGNESVAIELLRGGRTQQLKLPNANAVALLSITVNDLPRRIGNTPMPIVAPPVLILTKIKRWSFLAESTRPQSMRKAERDIQDIEVLLNWLVQNDLRIDFEGYPEKPKQELLSGVRKLYQMHAAVRRLLEATLKAEDFALIND